MECFIWTSSGGAMEAAQEPQPSALAASEREVEKKKKKNHENFSFPGSPSPPSTQAKTSLPAAPGLLFIFILESAA